MTERRKRDRPFPSGRDAQPQADGDPDFAGKRSVPGEDAAARSQSSPETRADEAVGKTRSKKSPTDARPRR